MHFCSLFPIPSISLAERKLFVKQAKIALYIGKLCRSHRLTQLPISLDPLMYPPKMVFNVSSTFIRVALADLQGKVLHWKTFQIKFLAWIDKKSKGGYVILYGMMVNMTGAHLNTDKIEPNLSVPGIQGCHK